MPPASSAIAGAMRFTSALAATLACVAIAPMVTPLPSALICFRSAIAPEVDQALGLRQAQPHRLDQALAAGEKARVGAGGSGLGGIAAGRPLVVECVHSLFSLLQAGRPLAARQTRSGVAGIARSTTPRASVSALM